MWWEIRIEVEEMTRFQATESGRNTEDIDHE